MSRLRKSATTFALPALCVDANVASFSIIIVAQICAASVGAACFWVWNDVLRNHTRADVLSAMCAIL